MQKTNFKRGTLYRKMYFLTRLINFFNICQNTKDPCMCVPVDNDLQIPM